jgi:hypothetical protein
MEEKPNGFLSGAHSRACLFALIYYMKELKYVWCGAI